MATRWRELLDFLNIPWTDTGRNTARGWISIACPWCGDDPSEHLGINEEHGNYHCLRNDRHDGKSPFWLLKALGVHHRDMDDLLRSYGSSDRRSAAPIERTVHREQSTSAFTHRWNSFTAAAGNPDALAYLHRRHFPAPERTAKEFDLRVGSGRWGRRLWFGLRDLAGPVTGFTGRALDDWRSPRYYTESPEATLYLPKPLSHHHRLALLVEGPMDALRVADTTQRRRHLLTVALCGLAVGGNRRWLLSQIARTVPAFALALDAGVQPTHRERLMAELRAIPALGRITRLRMPPVEAPYQPLLSVPVAFRHLPREQLWATNNEMSLHDSAGRADPGEMLNNEIERWLSTF